MVAHASAPTAWANLTPFCSVSARVGVGMVVEKNAPLSPIARANSPLASGEAICALTENDPADSPAIVTCAGSPPNCAMLSRTHSTARRWSSRPRLGEEEEAIPAALGKPKKLTR